MKTPLTMLKPLGGGEYSFRWQMLSAVPVIHQKCEAVADLMNLLRTLGMVLTSEPRTTVKHFCIWDLKEILFTTIEWLTRFQLCQSFCNKLVWQRILSIPLLKRIIPL